MCTQSMAPGAWRLPAASRLFRCESVVCLKVSAGWLGSGGSGGLGDLTLVLTLVLRCRLAQKLIPCAHLSADDVLGVPNDVLGVPMLFGRQTVPCPKSINQSPGKLATGRQLQPHGPSTLCFPAPCLLQRGKLCALLKSSFCLQGSKEVRMVGCVRNTGARRAGRRVRSVGLSGDGTGTRRGRPDRAPDPRLIRGGAGVAAGLQSWPPRHLGRCRRTSICWRRLAR